MTQNEFLSELEACLQGKLEDDVISRHLDSYRQYIGEQVSGGSTEEAVIDSLQSPQLIAKTILSSEEVKEEKEKESVFSRILNRSRNGDAFFSMDTLQNGPVLEKIALIVVVLIAILVVLTLFSAFVRILFWPVVIVSVFCVIWEFVKNGQNNRRQG